MSRDLEGKRVLVVGASAGIGRAFAMAAVRGGAHVALSARRADRLAEAVSDAGGGTAVVGDVRSEDDCRRIVSDAVAGLDGPLDLVFYAAGHAPLRALEDTTAEHWDAIFSTNVRGVHHVIAAAIPEIAPAGIVAVLSSETVGRPRTGLGTYSASKAALDETLRAWRVEHPEVRFSCLAVGATVPTEFGIDFDPEVLGPALESWRRHGFMQEEFMATDEVAEFLVSTLGAALAFPGLGVEHLLLRSPSPVIES